MKKIGLYLFMIIFILVMSWEYQREVSASLIEKDVIPENALRLRILANSDNPQDQWLKREVRDSVVQEVLDWVDKVDSLEEAEEKITQSMEELEMVVQETIESSGFEYPFSIKYGQITFPAKLYGDQFYPAGEYNGVLITIGEGQGDNWWCVLFPPLCFVDFGTGEVLDPDQEEAQEGKEQTEQKVEVRFFLVDLFDKIKSMFV